MFEPTHSQVPKLRIFEGNSLEVNPAGEFVLYWMTSNRRPDYNFALQRALDWARELGRPLLILEALRLDYPWASRRFHRFVMQGMSDNLRAFAEGPVTYFPYLERQIGEGKGLLQSLASRACLVVGDDFPCFFLPRMQAAAARLMPVRFERIDSNGILPLEAAPKVFERAVDFRRFLQKNLRPHLLQFPLVNPLQGISLPPLQEPLPEWSRWPQAGIEELEADLRGWALEGAPEVNERGGWVEARRCLTRFWSERLAHYSEKRSQPSTHYASGLSPYLHFGQISTHRIFDELAAREDWNVDRLSYRSSGSKDGSWGMSPGAEAFLDELITWRELGYNLTHRRQDYDRYESLPDWARKSLENHLQDPREHLYSLEEFEAARTHDPIWNAAQRQLLKEGRIHNYMRMLWGKKILEWTEHPRQALEVMIELNNKYALDGRNPNSYSGIFWCLGRYDRPWFERPIFGVIRYMSTQSAARKFNLTGYLQRWSDSQGRLF